MSNDSLSSIKMLLKQAGFPDFPLDDESFPDPRVVVRYFREKMVYIDPDDGKQKSWTQADLARRLGVSEVTVRIMENNGAGLDSIAKRRLLASLLKIPPVLLGLGSLTDLAEFLRSHEEGAIISAPTTVKGGGFLEKETVKLYQDAFTVYAEMHSTSTAQDSIFDIEQWINRIETDIPRANGHQRKQLQVSLWDFHALSAKVYSDDLCQWDQAFHHLNAAMELANLLGSNDLRAASLYRSGQIRFGQRNFFLAKTDLDAALQYAKNARPQLKGAVYAAAGLAHALVDSDEAGRLYAQSLFDQAGKIVTSPISDTDEYVIKFSVGKYLAEKADALIVLGRPGKALEVLDDAEYGTDPAQKRRLSYIDILRAEANMRLKKPELDRATDLLQGAFATSVPIKSEYNINYIQRLYGELVTSPYGNSPQVADLGIALRNWRKQ
jgi:transcriptional regulator with XRE-family HTH domain